MSHAPQYETTAAGGAITEHVRCSCSWSTTATVRGRTRAAIARAADAAVKQWMHHRSTASA